MAGFLTDRRVRVAAPLLVIGAALMVSALTTAATKERPLDGWPPQTVASRVEGVDGPAVFVPRDRFGRLVATDVVVEGARCNTSDSPVETVVTLSFQAHVGGPSVPLGDSFTQVQPPGCSWHLIACPDDLAELDGPAPAVSCDPPFFNQVPVVLASQYDRSSWVIAATVEPVDSKRIQAIAFESEPFRVVFAP